MHHDPLKIIQLSDTHLFADTSKQLLGVNTQDSFQAVLNILQTKANNFDFIIHSGDISQDGSTTSYKRFADMLQEFNLPIYYVPGNHDDNKTMSHFYPYQTVFNDKHIILKTWHIILLNSQIPGKVAGFFDDSQLHHLEHCLKSHPELFAMIVFHHQPFDVGSAWLDELGVKNANVFWDIIKRFPKVKTIFFGHVHQENEKILNNIQCYSLPSTCIQFKRDQDRFGLEDLPPGYRWIHLYEDGHFETGVERAAEYVGFFDVNAKGY